MMSVISISDLRFGYDEKIIFKNLSLNFGKGDFCSIIGPNGAGKTTLLKCMAGLYVPKSGKVQLFGKTLKEYSTKERARLIAYVPQNQEFVFDVSVYDYVLMGRNPYQSPWELQSFEDQEIVETALERCNVMQYRNTSLRALSGGERQRVMIARAIAQETEILLLDEPLSNIDISHKFDIMDILQGINEEKQVTVIIILHDLSIVSHYSKQILILKEGEMVKFGEKNEVFTEENIRKSFDLSDDYIVSKDGNVTKNIRKHLNI